VLDIGICNQSTILQTCAEGKAAALSASSTGPMIYLGKRTDFVADSVTPRVHLMLAVPRPLRLGRILTMVTMMGVGCIILIDSAKVEKEYFGRYASTI
jgi:hypothetical protein